MTVYNGDVHMVNNKLVDALNKELNASRQETAVLRQEIKSLKENKLIEEVANDNTTYKFEYNDGDLSNCYTNPLIIGDDSFAITISNCSISDEEVDFILKNNLKILNNKYLIDIKSISYEAKDIMDESNRIEALEKLTDVKIDKDRNIKKKTKINYVNPLISILGR